MPQPTTRKAHLDSLAVCLLLACCMFWGFQQVLVKATVAEVAPVFQAFVRFALATVAVAAWCLWRGVRLSMAGEPAGAARAGLLAGALFAGEFACIYLGLQYTTASRLTVFLYASPFWVALLLPRFIPGERLQGWQWLGLGEAWVWQFSGFAWGSLLVQALVGAFVSYLAWMWMLAHYPATKISVFVFLTPVFALLFGALWLGEPVTPGLVAALVLVAAGIVLVNRKSAAA